MSHAQKVDHANMASPSTLHLKKLCVGAYDVGDLESWQEGGCAQLARQLGYDTPFHRTRRMPKRSDEILKGGSLFWVIKRRLCVRQKIIEFRKVDVEGQTYCDILFDPKLVLVEPKHARPFQGWRYLEHKDAPRDLHGASADAPASLLAELEQLGLL